MGETAVSVTPTGYVTLFAPTGYITLFTPTGYATLFTATAYVTIFTPTGYATLFTPTGYVTLFTLTDYATLSFLRSGRRGGDIVLLGRNWSGNLCQRRPSLSACCVPSLRVSPGRCPSTTLDPTVRDVMHRLVDRTRSPPRYLQLTLISFWTVRQT